jgi:peptidoglycan/LPS O-acetylase OafA/YrhL
MSDSRESSFRPEIEGLRATAATLVAVFHIWLGRVSGGVDVFFVVSSFLITTGLLGMVERTGRVDFLRFWGRLIRRLLPAALLVLGAIIVASVLFESKARWKDTILGVAASATYVENWLLAHDAVDYLQQNGPSPPVQHFWALSVQGQFYLLWPCLFFIALWISRAANVAFRKVLVAALIVLFAVSMAFSIYITRANQAVAYFHTGARIWEFCIGAVLAIYISRISLPNGLRLIAGWLGLFAIVFCGIIFQVSRVFRGYAALWPTVAACMVIIAGTTRGFGADKLLGSRPLVYLGGIAYGIYLWHFPILAFAKAYAIPNKVSNFTGACILVASVLLAALTRKFVEAPLRAPKGSTEPRWKPFALAAALGFPIAVGLGAWSLYYKHLHAQAFDKRLAAREDHPGAAALAPDFDEPDSYDAPVYPSSLVVYEDREQFGDAKCTPRAHITVPQGCILGEPDGKFVLVVVGGSHSTQWLPALEQIARREKWKIVSMARVNCPFHLGPVDVLESELASCGEWNRNVVKAIRELKPDAVFTTSTRQIHGDEYVPAGYVAAWRALGEDIRVIALRDNPKVEFEAPECVELHGEDEEKCGLLRAQALEVPSPTEMLANPPSNVRFIDLSNYFCDERKCPPVIGNVMVYRHYAHVTATYVMSLEPMLTRAMESALQTAPTPRSWRRAAAPITQSE